MYRRAAIAPLGPVLALVVCAGLAQAASVPVERASERIRAGDLPAAERELNTAIQSGVADANTYSLLGLICSRTGRLDQAIAYYRQALRMEPAMEAARNGLGAALIERGDLEEALKLFRAVLNSSPTDVTAVFNIGVILAEQGRYADSIASLESAHKLATGDAVVSMWLARVHMAVGDMQPALECLDGALGSMAKNSRGHANTGLIAEALEVSARLRAAFPDPRALFLLAEAQFLAGKYDAALESLDQMPEKERRPEYYRLLGMSYVGRKDLTAATNALERGLKLAPANPDLLFSIGTVYQGAGDNEKAIGVFRRAIAAGDHSAEVQFALALSYFNFGSYQQAVNHCNLAIQSNAEFDQAYLLLARSWSKLAQPEQAIAALKKSLTINPGCEQCHLQLGLILAGRDLSAEAEMSFREAIRLNPGDVTAHYELGRILAKENHAPEAVAELRKAIELDSGNDRAYYQLGRVYLAMGDKANARICLDTVRDLKEKRRAASEERLSRSR